MALAKNDKNINGPSCACGKAGLYEEWVKMHVPKKFGAAVVICVSFLPFFAMKEISRVMGSEKFRGMFLRKRQEPLP